MLNKGKDLHARNTTEMLYYAN